MIPGSLIVSYSVKGILPFLLSLLKILGCQSNQDTSSVVFEVDMIQVKNIGGLGHKNVTLYEFF